MTLSLWVLLGLVILVAAALLFRRGRRVEAVVALGVLVALVVWLILEG